MIYKKGDALNIKMEIMIQFVNDKVFDIDLETLKVAIGSFIQSYCDICEVKNESDC